MHCALFYAHTKSTTLSPNLSHISCYLYSDIFYLPIFRNKTALVSLSVLLAGGSPRLSSASGYLVATFNPVHALFIFLCTAKTHQNNELLSPAKLVSNVSHLIIPLIVDCSNIDCKQSHHCSFWMIASSNRQRVEKQSIQTMCWRGAAAACRGVAGG